MSKKEKSAAYYEKTRDGAINPDTMYACSLVGDDKKIAIDCGCGSGRNIAFLLDQQFEVHAFDVDADAITICKERFADQSRVSLSEDSFESFAYPEASLVVAAASLFFCPQEQFDEAWRRIVASLRPSGIFFGMFMGPKDTWAVTEKGSTAFGDVLVFSESELKLRFADFDILRWTERDEVGTTALGTEKHWHLYSVVARKKEGAV